MTRRDPRMKTRIAGSRSEFREAVRPATLYPATLYPHIRKDESKQLCYVPWLNCFLIHHQFYQPLTSRNVTNMQFLKRKKKQNLQSLCVHIWVPTLRRTSIEINWNRNMLLIDNPREPKAYWSLSSSFSFTKRMKKSCCSDKMHHT